MNKSIYMGNIDVLSTTNLTIKKTFAIVFYILVSFINLIAGKPGETYKSVPDLLIAKTVSSGPVLNANGTYDLTIDYSIENVSGNNLTNLQVYDLLTPFNPLNSYTFGIVSPNLTLNPNFDAIVNSDILTGNDALAPGETADFQILINVGPYTTFNAINDLVEVEATDPNGVIVEEEDSLLITFVPPSPSVEIVKTLNSSPTLNNNGTYDVTFDFYVENTGNVNLSNLQITDVLTAFAPVNTVTFGTATPNLGLNTAFDGATDSNLLAGTDTFAPGENGNLQLSINVGPGNNFTSIDNVADVTGTGTDGNTYNANSTVTVNFPSTINNVDMSKSVNGTPILNADGTYDVTFDFYVENTGNVNLSNLQITDALTAFAPVNSIAFGTATPNLSLNTAFDGSIDINLLAGTDTFAPGENGNLQFSINVGPGNNLNSIINIADVTGTGIDGNTYNSNSIARVNFPVPNNSIYLLKTVNGRPVLNADGTYDIIFDFYLENNGNVNLSNLQITDVLTAFAPVNSVAFGTVTPNLSLNTAFNGFGDTNLLTGTNTVSPGESGEFELLINVGPNSNFSNILNTADISGLTPNLNTTVNNSSVAVRFPQVIEAIELTKSISSGPSLNSDGTYDIVFDFFVENSGNVNLSNLQITDVLTAFAPINNISFGSNTPNLSLNPGFNGLTNSSLLAGGDVLAPSEIGNLELTINVGPGTNFNAITNEAETSGLSPEGNIAAGKSDVNTVFPAITNNFTFTKTLFQSPALNADGTYDYAFKFEIVNTGNVNLTGLQITDNLTQYAPVNNLNIFNFTSNIVPNSNFDGILDDNLIFSTNTLAPSENVIFYLSVNSGPYNPVQNIISNTADAEMLTLFGNTLTNQSSADAFFDSPNSDIDIVKTLVNMPTQNDDGTFDLFFKIDVENTGDLILNNIQITDDLSTFNNVNSAIISNASANFSPNGIYDGILDINALQGIDSFTPGEVGSFTIEVNVGPYTGQQIFTNTAKIEVFTNAGQQIINSDDEIVTIEEPNASLSINKFTLSGPFLNNNGTYDIVYRIELTNTGAVILTDIQVTDDLSNIAPINSTTVTSASSTISPDSNYDGITNISTLTGFDSLLPGETGKFDITVNVGPYSTLPVNVNNIADVTCISPNGATISNTDSEPINLPATLSSLSISKTILNGPVLNIDGTYDATFLISIENTGSLNLSNVQIEDDLNAFLPINSVNITNTSANLSSNGTYNGTTDINTLTGNNTLSPNERGSLNININFGPAPSFINNILNEAVADAENPNGTLISVSSNINAPLPPVAAQLSTQKKLVNPPVLNANGTYDLEFIISIDNTGNVALNNLQIEDDLSVYAPINITTTANASANISLNANFNGISNSNLLQGIDQLLPGESANFSLYINVGPYAQTPAAGTLLNAIEASATDPLNEVISSNDTEITDLPTSNSNLIVNKVFTGNSTASTNGTYDVEFTINITNSGNIDLNNIQITDDLSVFSPINSVSINNPTPNITINSLYDGLINNTLLNGFDQLAAGQSASLEIILNVGPYDNTVNTNAFDNTASATALDANGTVVNGSSSVPSPLNSISSSINIDKTILSGPVLLPDGSYDVSYLFEVVNTGTVNLSEIQVVDDLSAFSPVNGISFSNASANLSPNATYSGLSDINTLLGIDSFKPGELGSFELSINVGPYLSTPPSFILNETFISGKNPANEIVRDSDSVETYFSALQASFNVEKTLLNNPTLNGDGTIDLVFNIVLTNTGNVNLSSLQVVDELNIFTPVNSANVVNTSSNISPNSSYDGISNLNTLLGIDSFSPGQTATFDIITNVGPYSFTPANLFNEIEATAKDPTGNVITETTNEPVILPEQEPAISIVKSNAGTPVLKNDGSYDIAYSLEIANNGNANLSNVQILDNLSNFAPVNNVSLSNASANLSSNANYNGINDQNILLLNTTLVPGETGSIQLNLNVGPYASNISSLTNTAFVNGLDPGNNAVADTSDVNTVLPTVSSQILIDKTILNGPQLLGDGTYETVYFLEITNAGNTDLTNIQLSDDLSIFAPLNNISVSNVTANFTSNIGYNGQSDINLLTGNNSLASLENGALQITINSGPYGSNFYNVDNIATVTAKDPVGVDLQENDIAATTFAAPQSMLGLSKALITSPTLLQDGTFDILFRLFAENSGNVAINDLQITDDLSNTFSIAPNLPINSVNLINASSNFSTNTNFNGSTDIDLLSNNNKILPGENGYIDVEVNFGPLPQNNSDVTFFNTAVAFGFDPSLVLVTDTSTNGLDPDPENDGPGDNSEPTPISTTPPEGQVGVAKKLISLSSILTNGTYDIVYEILIENTGPIVINDIQISDNLAAAFSSIPTVSVNNAILNGATSNISLNPDFNGISDNNLLAGTDSFSPGEQASFRIETNVGIVPQPGGTFLNQAFATAVDANGSSISDGSHNGSNVDPEGDGPLDNKEPTPVTLQPGLASLNVEKTIISQPVLNQNGTYDLSFNITVENAGFVPLFNLKILDVLVDFAPINNVTIANTSSNLSPNPAYNGLLNTNLLTGNDALMFGESGNLDVFLNVGPYPGNIDEVINIAIATALDENDIQIFDEDSAIVNYGEINSDLEINKFVVAGPTDNEDGTYEIIFRINILNNGNVNLDNVQITDDLLDYAPINSINFQNVSSNLSTNGSYDGINNVFLLNGNNSLAPAEGGSIDLELNVGPFSTSLPNLKNFATVSAISPNGQQILQSDFIDTPIDFLTPEIEIIKTLVTPPTLNTDGTYDFNFLIQVSNSGLIQLNDLQIIEDLNNFAPINNLNVSNVSTNLSLNLSYDGITNTNILTGTDQLQTTEAGTFNIELNAGPFINNPNSLLNTVTTNALSSNNIVVEDVDTALMNLETYQPELVVQKRLFGGPVINNDGTYNINYLISIENRGNTVLNNVTLTDNLADFAPVISTSVSLPSFTLFANNNYDGITDINLLQPNNVLEPGETGIINLDIVVGPYQTVPGSLSNEVVATGIDPIYTLLTSDATAPTPFNIADPELAVSKTLIEQPELQSDGSYTFSYLINIGNIGPVEITDLQVQDDLSSFAPVNNAVVSAPTANLSLNPTYDGLFNINTLAGIDVLGTSQIAAFKLTVNAGPFNQNTNSIINTAIASGKDPSNNTLFKSVQEPTNFEFFDAAINVDKLLITPPTLNEDGTYEQMYFINIANIGSVELTGLQLVEDLTQYAPLNEVQIISPSANLSPNPIFDGLVSKNLLTGLDILMPGEQASMAILFNSGPYNPSPQTLINSITVYASDPLGNDIQDVATEESTFNAEAPKISVSKTLDASPVQLPNGTFNLLFNIDVENIGNVSLQNLQLIDDLSVYQLLNSAEIVNATPTLSKNFAFDGLSNTSMLFGFDNLAPGEFGKLQLLINVGPYDSIPQNLKNEVNAFALSPNETIITGRAIVETPIEPVINEVLLAKRLTELPKLLNDGSYNLSYNFVIQNTGNTSLSNLQLTDDLTVFGPVNSSQVLFTSANISPNAYFNGISDVNLLTGLNNLLPGELASLNLQLNVGPYTSQADTLFNSATVLAVTPTGQSVQDLSGFTLGNNAAENLPTPTPLSGALPNLTITKSLPANPTINDDGSFTTTFIVQVENTGNVALSNLQLEDDLNIFAPVNNAFISDFSSNLSVNNSFDGLSNINLLSTNNSLIPNEVARLEITLNVGPYTNTVTLNNQIFGEAISPEGILVKDASDGILNNSTFDDPTPVTFIHFTEVDLSINKQAITPIISENETGTFLITITNNSTLNTAHNITVNELLPNELNYTGHSTDSGTFNPFNLQWLIDSLPPQSSANLTLQIESNSIGTFINNCIITAVDEKETNIFDNESNASITIGEPFIDLQLTKIALKDSLSFGDTASFEILIENLSNSFATGVLVEEILPENSVTSNYLASSGSYDSATNKWFLDAIAPQGIDTLSISLVVDAGGSFTNTATIIDVGQPDEFINNNTSSATIYITEPVSDLGIVKTVSIDTVLQNETLDFNIVLTNNGNFATQNITVEEVLPGSFSYQSHFVSSGSFNPLSNLWFINSIRAGRSETLTLSVKPTAIGSFTNTVDIIESEPLDTLSFNNTSSIDVTVLEIPTVAVDLSIEKTVQNDTIDLGEAATFYIELTNNSEISATNIIVEELLPESFTYLSHQLSSGDFYSISNIWEIDDIAPGSTEILTLNVLPNQTGTFLNSVYIVENEPVDTFVLNNNSNVNITVNEVIVIEPAIDIGIEKTVQNDTIDFGGTATFYIELTNNSNITAANIIVEELMPESFTYLSHQLSSGDFYSISNIWEIDDIAPGSTEILILTVLPNQTGTFLNPVYIVENEPVDTFVLNNSSNVNITVKEVEVVESKVDISIQKTVQKDIIDFGESATFDILITNNSNTPAEKVIIEELLPKPFTYLSHQLTTGNFYALSNIWEINDLQPDSTEVLTLTVLPDQVGTFLNSAYILETQPTDTVAINNNSSASLTIKEVVVPEPKVDISIQKTVQKDIIDFGKPATFDILITNNSDTPAEKVIVEELLPEPFIYLSHQLTTGNFYAPSNIWEIDDIAPGSTEILTLTVLPDQVGTFLNSAYILETQPADTVAINNNSSASLTIKEVIVPEPKVDISIQKAVQKDTIDFGEPATFDILITNNSDIPAEKVIVEELLPEPFIYLYHQLTNGNFYALSNIWEINDLLPDSTEILTLTVLPDQVGTFLNSAYIVETQPADTVATNNNSSASLTIKEVIVPEPEVDISIQKTVQKDTIDFGEPATFDILITNNSNIPAEKVIVEELMPASFMYLSHQLTKGNYYALSNIWEIDNLASSSTASLTLSVLPNQTGTFINAVAITETEPIDTIVGNNSSEASITVQEIPISFANLSVNKTVQKDTTNINETITFNIEVSNIGTTTANNIIVEELLPGGLVYQTYNASTGSFDTTSNRWNISTLAPNQTALLNIIMISSETGNFTNTVNIIQSEPIDTALTNNSSSINITIIEEIIELPTIDLSINNRVQDDIVFRGETTTFNIELINNSNTTANNIIVEELMPAELLYQTHTTENGSFNPINHRWNIDMLSPGQAAMLNVTCMANGVGNFTNTVNIVQSEPVDTILTNNTSSVELIVEEKIVQTPIVDLSIIKTVENQTIYLNETTTFTIEVSNNSNTTANNIIVKELMPGELLYQTHTTATGSFNAMNNIWNIDVLLPGQAAVLNVTCMANGVGNFTNTVNIVQSEPVDTILTNNTSSVELIVEEKIVQTPTVDLSINKTVQDDEIFRGETATFYIELTNNSNTTANNIIVEELMPAELLYQTHNTVTGSFNAVNNRWNISALPPGQTALLSITCMPNGLGNVINKVNIIQSEPVDTILHNNTSSVEIIVAEEIIEIPTVDLSINKTVENDTINLNETATFTIEISNNSNTIANDIIIEELLPGGLSYQTHSTSIGSYNAVNNSWVINTLTPNETASLILNVKADEIGSFTNTVNLIQSNPVDTVLSNNTSTADLLVEDKLLPTSNVDLLVNKIAQNDTLTVGETATFSIELTNNSNTTANNIVVEELLPQQLSYQTHTTTLGSFNTLNNRWFVNQLSPNQNANLTFTVTANEAGNFTNMVNIVSLDEGDPNVTNNRSSADIYVKEFQPEPAKIDLGITKSVSNEIVELDDNVIFETVVSNISEETATQIIIEEILPGGLEYISHTTSAGIFDRQSKIWDIPVLQAQRSVKLEVEVKAIELGTLVNVANIVSANEIDDNIMNDRTSAAVLVNEKTSFADLRLSKSTNKPIADIDEQVEFTIIVANYGPDDAGNIVVEAILSNTLNYIDHNATSGEYSLPNGRWNIDNIAANTSVAMSITCNSSITGEHTNIASIITSDALDSDVSNNMDDVAFTVLSTVQDPCLSPVICSTISECTETGSELRICPEFCAEGNFTINNYSTLLSGNNIFIEGNCIYYTAFNSLNNTSDVLRIEAENDDDVCTIINANIEIKNCDEPNLRPVITNDEAKFCGAPTRSTTICVEAFDENIDDLSICEISTLFDCSLGNTENLCFTYKPLPAFYGADEISVTVCDNGNPSLSTTATYYLDIACVTPTLNSDYLSVSNSKVVFNDSEINYDGGVVIINPLENDFVTADCYNKLELKSVSTVSNATGHVMLVDGQIQFQPNASFSSNDAITYRACNNCGVCETGNIFIEGEMQNCQLFRETCSPTSANLQICVEFCSTETGIDNVSSLYNATISTVNERCFTYNGNGLVNVTDTLKVTGKDARGNTETVRILNYVNDDCLKPLAIDDAFNTQERHSILFDVTLNDEPITNNYELKIIKNATNGSSAKSLNGNILYKPNYGFTGLDELTYELCNAHSNCDKATVYLTVEDDNMPNLIAFNDNAVTNESTAILIDVLANDTLISGINIQLTVTTDPLFGTAKISGNNIEYIPFQNFTGEDFFEYELCNEYNECDKAIVQVNVTEAMESIVSINEFSLPQSLEIYQILNGSNTIDIQINSTENKIIDYYLFDVLGRSLQSGALNLVSGKNVINLEKPADGTQMLMFCLKSDNYFQSEKVYVY